MAYSTFNKVIGKVLVHEGGYVDHPKDPGGATNKGVTLATFRRYIKPGGTKDDLRKLTTAQAAHCYRKFYWDKISGDELPAGLDYAVFDFAVNSGPGRAAKYLQAVVGAKQDGKIGPATIAAAEGVDVSIALNRLCDNRLAFMKRIRGGSLWKTFGRGWQRRVDDVRREALKLAGSTYRAQYLVTNLAANDRVSTTKLASGAAIGIGSAQAAVQTAEAVADLAERGRTLAQVAWSFGPYIFAGLAVAAVAAYAWQQRSKYQRLAKMVEG